MQKFNTTAFSDTFFDLLNDRSVFDWKKLNNLEKLLSVKGEIQENVLQDIAFFGENDPAS